MHFQRQVSHVVGHSKGCVARARPLLPGCCCVWPRGVDISHDSRFPSRPLTLAPLRPAPIPSCNTNPPPPAHSAGEQLSLLFLPHPAPQGPCPTSLPSFAPGPQFSPLPEAAELPHQASLLHEPRTLKSTTTLLPTLPSQPGLVGMTNGVQLQDEGDSALKEPFSIATEQHAGIHISPQRASSGARLECTRLDLNPGDQTGKGG